MKRARERLHSNSQCLGSRIWELSSETLLILVNIPCKAGSISEGFGFWKKINSI